MSSLLLALLSVHSGHSKIMVTRSQSGVSQESVRSQSAVSQESVRSQSAVNQESVRSQSGINQESVRSQSAVSQQSVRSQSGVSQESVRTSGQAKNLAKGQDGPRQPVKIQGTTWTRQCVPSCPPGQNRTEQKRTI